MICPSARSETVTLFQISFPNFAVISCFRIAIFKYFRDVLCIFKYFRNRCDSCYKKQIYNEMSWVCLCVSRLKNTSQISSLGMSQTKMLVKHCFTTWPNSKTVYWASKLQCLQILCAHFATALRFFLAFLQDVPKTVPRLCGCCELAV